MKYTVSIFDAPAFRRYIIHMNQTYGISDNLITAAQAPLKPWPVRAAYNIYLDNEDKYGAVISVEATDADEESAQAEFLRDIHAFNIWPQPLKEH